jgi:DASS family divalent anion:Na+ symporter
MGCSAHLITALLGYFSSLSACLTNYGSGTLAMYFSLGYIPRKKWFELGFMTFLIILGVYITFGAIWWKIIGWY